MQSIHSLHFLVYFFCECVLFLIYIFCYLSSRFNVLAIFFWFSCWFILYASQRQRLCIATLNFFCVVRFWLAVGWCWSRSRLLLHCRFVVARRLHRLRQKLPSECECLIRKLLVLGHGLLSTCCFLYIAALLFFGSGLCVVAAAAASCRS